MQVVALIGAIVLALAVLGVVYFAWRIEQDVTTGGAGPVVPVVIIGAGGLLLWLLWRRV